MASLMFSASSPSTKSCDNTLPDTFTVIEPPPCGPSIFGDESGVTLTCSRPPGLSQTINICGPEGTKSAPVAAFCASICATFPRPAVITPAIATKFHGGGADAKALFAPA